MRVIAMAYEIIVRRRRDEAESSPTPGPEPRSDGLQCPEKFANDNEVAWPLIPFPDGWLGG